MRLTADGKFHLCLLNDDELDVGKAIRSGASLAQIGEILVRAVTLKSSRHQLLAGRSDRSMVTKSAGNPEIFRRFQACWFA